ncbi:hypothetical protein OQA88_329 [Cercophora sp. LCS_1]
MATALARGLQPRLLLLVRTQAQAPRLSTPHQTLSLRRHLQTTPHPNAVLKTTPHPPTPSKPLPSYAEQLARKNRTLLYEAPSHFWYRFSSLGAGLFCMSYTTYQYWAMYISPPPDLTWWVPHAMGFGAFIMAGMGCWFALGVTRIVRSIEAVATPSTLPRTLKPIVPQSPIYVEIQTQRMIPFTPRKKMQLWPEQIGLSWRMSDAVGAGVGVMGQRPLTQKEKVENARREREEKEKRREYDRTHLMTVPFRDGKRAVSTMWGGLRRAFHREGFMDIKLDGQKYKIDVLGGWALENGRAIDRVLAVKKGI